jgi:hypothetical protein
VDGLSAVGAVAVSAVGAAKAAVVFVLSGWRAAFFARVLATMNALSPCGAADVACVEQHEHAASVIASVALKDPNPEDAAARLLGAGAHETGFRTKLQKNGPAVSWFQLEVPNRPFYLANDVDAARRALGIARMCRGSMIGYASGNCGSKDWRVLDTARQLRGCIESARRGGTWKCSNLVPKPPPKPKKGKARKGKRTS